MSQPNDEGEKNTEKRGMPPADPLGDDSRTEWVNAGQPERSDDWPGGSVEMKPISDPPYHNPGGKDDWAV